MKKNTLFNTIKLSLLILICLLFSGCYIFEKINDAYPLPEKNYDRAAKKFTGEYQPRQDSSAPAPPRVDYMAPKTESQSFQDWHNSQ